MSKNLKHKNLFPNFILLVALVTQDNSVAIESLNKFLFGLSIKKLSWSTSLWSQNNPKESRWNTRECIKQARTDSDRKLRAMFRALFDHLDTSGFFANLRDYTGWNSEILGVKMSTIRHTEFQIWFLWWKVFCRKLQLHLRSRISRHPKWVKLSTLFRLY